MQAPKKAATNGKAAAAKKDESSDSDSDSSSDEVRVDSLEAPHSTRLILLYPHRRRLPSPLPPRRTTRLMILTIPTLTTIPTPR